MIFIVKDSMFTKFVSFPIFLVSLSIGLFFVYLMPPPFTTIYVYPTPENVDDVQYKDAADGCFQFDAHLVECNSKELPIPIQQIM